MRAFGLFLNPRDIDNTFLFRGQVGHFIFGILFDGIGNTDDVLRRKKRVYFLFIRVHQHLPGVYPGKALTAKRARQRIFVQNLIQNHRRITMHHLHYRNIMMLKAGYVIQIHRKIADDDIGLFGFYQTVKQVPRRQSLATDTAPEILQRRRCFAVDIGKANPRLQFMPRRGNAEFAVSIAGNDYLMPAFMQQIGKIGKPVVVEHVTVAHQHNLHDIFLFVNNLKKPNERGTAQNDMLTSLTLRALQMPMR